MRISLALLLIALIAKNIGATPVKSSANETFGIVKYEYGKQRPQQDFLQGRLVYGQHPRLHFVKNPSPEKITPLVIASLRDFVRELKGFVSRDLFRFVLFRRKIEQFGSTLREIEGLINLGKHSDEAQQRLAYAKTLFLTMTRTAANMRRFLLLTTSTGELAISYMSLVHLRAVALHDSRGEFPRTLAHSVRRIMCLKQDVDSWEAAFGKLKSVHFLTKLIFSDLVDRTRAQIMSLESKIPRDRAFWSQDDQPHDGEFHCLA